MSYFASFQEFGGAIFRLDTRVYLADDAAPCLEDICVAAIIGKNPGSARSKRFVTLSPLDLHGDKMLPSVRKRFIAAYERASKPIPRSAFVRVWNLFYLCDEKLSSAKRRFASISSPLLCPSEGASPPIVWFAWGGADPVLDAMKGRFRRVPFARPFFYDKNRDRIVSAIPQATDFPKHPQGLLEEPIVEFLSKIL